MTQMMTPTKSTSCYQSVTNGMKVKYLFKLGGTRQMHFRHKIAASCDKRWHKRSCHLHVLTETYLGDSKSHF